MHAHDVNERGASSRAERRARRPIETGAAERRERTPPSGRTGRMTGRLAGGACGVLLGGTVLLVGGCATGSGGPSLDDLKGVAGEVLGGGSGEGAAGALSGDEIVRGLKEALASGSSTVVAQLGREGGFENDPRIRIPLPESLQRAKELASKVGLGGQFEALETRLNRAAEEATPKAKSLFLGAIRSMSVEDARGILQGPDDAATQYFRGRTGTQLQGEMRPIVTDALADVGAVSTFERLASRYNAIPGLPPLEADLTGYVVDEGIDGIFTYLAEEEKAIRENPLKRTSEILQRVFGSR